MDTILVASLPGVVIALATAFFSSRFYAARAKADLQKEYESRFNERKWDTYTKFTDTVRKIVESSKGKRVERDLPKFVQDISRFTSSLWLVGSDEIVRAYIDWQRDTRNPENLATNKLGVLSKLMGILIEMRRDLGYRSTTVTPTELLYTFITDVDDHAA